MEITVVSNKSYLKEIGKIDQLEAQFNIGEQACNLLQVIYYY